jgi:AraC family transcriptional regulator
MPVIQSIIIPFIGYTESDLPNGFEKIVVPKLTWAVFETGKMKMPTRDMTELRKQAFSQWLPTSDYVLVEGPEIEVYYWFRDDDRDKRYCELWMPVEKKEL